MPKGHQVVTVKTLWIQRKQSYAGQYGPEALVIQDQFSEEENSDWFGEQVEKELKMLGDEIESHAVIEITLNMDTILECLSQVKKMEGEIVVAPTPEPDAVRSQSATTNESQGDYFAERY